ncbi:sodium- and chloride-dependent glycine transporter 1-like isoform X1 [Haliotis rufescens]|uniref:sodium- and chloride-dependent glycine transporter 1-like isoform X1 n=1 Tax=Haliotis rufescens TaxID=6454 RepID=UPI00201F653D|nr:sodium- and chloride-dependent glycine transporter 1-like isoform X1 [Haliotis rufescens]
MMEKTPQDVATAEGGVADSETGKEGMKRGNWGGKLEFILTCVGYAVGLGNVWRFPYLAFKNGGGAFLIPYWIMQLFVGMPLFFMELSFGQFASLGPITVWKVNPLFKGLGYSMVIVSGLIGVYYNVIIGWCFFYFFSSMQGTLPWSHCNNEWNSPNCIVDSRVANNSNATLNITMYNTTISASEDYFLNYVLKMSDGLENMGGLNWRLSLCLLLAWFVVFGVLIKGIKSLGKVVYFTATFPYLLLTALLIRGATLDGASDGIKFYLTPDWSRLADSEVWSDAATQVFYSLSACSGGLVLMASFNKFDNNCLRDALIVPLVDCLTSFFSGFVVFTVLGFMAYNKQVSVADVAAGGPGLAFVAYPEALASMPAPTVWAILFFFMMVIIGFSSQFSIIETIISSISDEYDWILRKSFRNSTLFRVSLCVAFYLMALPMTTNGGMYLLELVDSTVSGFPLLFVGLLECMAINYAYGYSRFSEDISMMLGKRPSIYWRFCWCFMTPAMLFTVIVFKSIQYKPLKYGDYVYPDWAQALSWLVALFPIGAIPGWFLFYFLRNGGWDLMKQLSIPLPGWGPALEQNRKFRYAGTRELAQIAIQKDADDERDVSREMDGYDPKTGGQERLRFDKKDDGQDNLGYTKEDEPPSYQETFTKM